MKKLLILISAIPFFAYTQENKKAESNKKISVGFTFSPDYNYRALKNTDDSSYSDYIINFRNDIEKGKFSFTTGFNINLKIGRKLELQSGLLYSNKGYRSPKQVPVYAVQPSGAPSHIKSKASFHYIDVPLKLNFVSGKGNLKFIAGGGFAAGLLLKKADILTLYYPNGSEKELDQSDKFDYKKFNLTVLVSAGVEYPLRKNIFLRAEPTLRYGLLKIIDMPVTAKLWNIGLNMGVYCDLK